MSILNLEGAHENELATSGEFNPLAPRTALMLPTGQRIVVPTELLLQVGSERTATPVAQELEATRRDAAETVTPIRLSGSNGEGTMIPLIAEELLVGKAQRETAHVRLRRETEEHVETVSVPLKEVRWEVEHIQVGRLVEAPPEFRQVGDTTIFPLVEERLVVTRELWLREEVHVRKVETTVEKQADFVVKRDVLLESRTETGAGEV